MTHTLLHKCMHCTHLLANTFFLLISFFNTSFYVSPELRVHTKCAHTPTLTHKQKVCACERGREKEGVKEERRGRGCVLQMLNDPNRLRLRRGVGWGYTGRTSLRTRPGTIAHVELKGGRHERGPPSTRGPLRPRPRKKVLSRKFRFKAFFFVACRSCCCCFRGQFHQSIGEKYNYADARTLVKSVAPTKLYQLTKLEVTPNFYT